ncbi:GNAT family N-acetyltransferase [Falsiroseomonas sp.]|uniref:GNAT family N-acetyltransferase n=1 Tax=Falsiroseomonas sp. TaxID=2870721 RepID=UPI003F70F1FF
MTPAIRPAWPGDAAPLHRLVQDHARFEQARAPLTLAELAALLAADPPPIRLLVAEGAGRILGYAAITFDWSLWRARPYGHLEGLFVAAESRGAGLGARLLHAARDAVAAAGADRLEWQTPAWNADAIRFYRRAGAVPAEKTRFTWMAPGPA